MGWEVRSGRWYLYRNERVGGRRVKVYLTRASQPAAAVLLEHALGTWHRRRAEGREAARTASAELRARVTGLLREVSDANAELSRAAGAVLAAAGFHRHHRGEWRMKRKPSGPDKEGRTAGRRADAAVELQPGERPGVPADTPPPLVEYAPPTWHPGAADLFVKARAGDKAAQKELRGWLLTTPNQLDWYGDLGMRATQVLVARATGGDPVWQAAVEEKVKAMTAELLGPSPTLLDRLLVRRVVNAWVAVHALELEQAINPPARPRDRAYLEAAVGRASKRMTQAVSELARVRRLKLPPVLVTVSPPQPPPRLAEVFEATAEEKLVKPPAKRKN